MSAHAEQVGGNVVRRINKGYELDQAFVEQVRRWIVEEVDQMSRSSMPVEETVDKQSKEKPEKPEKLKKDRPKRQPTAYNNYVKKLSSELKDLSSPERMTEIGKRWSALSKEEQDAYKS